MDTCEECRGKGSVAYYDGETDDCSLCCGTGQVPSVLRSGVWSEEDSTSCIVWRVYLRVEAEAYVQRPVEDDDFASILTGWARHYSGPGRWFSQEPTVRVFGRKLLVKQYRALDI